MADAQRIGATISLAAFVLSCHPATTARFAASPAAPTKVATAPETLPSNEVLTPWPAIDPCAEFATLLAEQGSESEKLTWSGPRSRTTLMTKRIAPRGPTDPAPPGLARDRPERLSGTPDTTLIVKLEASCADGGAIAWDCGSTTRPECGVEVHYPRRGARPAGVRGRDCRNRYREHAALPPPERARVLLGDALALIDRVCIEGRCTPAVDDVARRLRAARAVGAWKIEPVNPDREWKLTRGDDAIELSCNDDVSGFSRCMIELDEFAYQQEEDVTDCAGGGENLLMPDGGNYIREEARGFEVAGRALRRR